MTETTATTAPDTMRFETDDYSAARRLLSSGNYGILDEDKALKGLSEIKMPTFGMLDKNYWERAFKGVVRRMLYGRAVGTYVYTYLEDEVPRAYEKKGSEYAYQGLGYDILRKGADGLNVAYDFTMGDGASHYELTDEGKAHFAKDANLLNKFLIKQFGLVRHAVDPNEKDEAGNLLYRKRRYTMTQRHLTNMGVLEDLRKTVGEKTTTQNGFDGVQIIENIRILREEADESIIGELRQFAPGSGEGDPLERLLRNLNLTKDQSEATHGKYFISPEHVQRIREIQEALTKDKTKAVDKLLELEASLGGKEIDYGQYQMRLGTGFAFMGLADFASHKVVERVAGTVQFLDKYMDPQWRKSEEFAVWKKNFNLFGSVKKFTSEIAIDAIRGDGLYDFFAGLAYAPIKEHFSREQEGIDRKIEVENGTVRLKEGEKGPEYGTGLKDLNTLFNVPFVMYNWLGKFVWQDLLVDWWLVPGQSKLLKYFKEHDKDNEGLALPMRAWNRVVQFSSFCVQRTAQVWAFMWPAVTQGFSRWRYYGKNAVQELGAVRRDEVKGAIIEAMLEGLDNPSATRFVAGGKDATGIQHNLSGLEKLDGKVVVIGTGESAREYRITRDAETGKLVVPPEIIKAIKEASETKRTHVTRTVADLVSEDVRRYKTRERSYDAAEAVFEVLGLEKGERSGWMPKEKGSYKAALAAAGRAAEADFYIKYITGERPRINFVPEDEDKDKRASLLEGVGEGVKKFTEVYSGAVQQVNLLKLVKTAEKGLGPDEVAQVKKRATGRDYVHALLDHAVERGVITISNIKYEIKQADQTAGAYVGYAPYFALKDAYTEIVENNPLINAPINAFTSFTNAFTFRAKHTNVAQEKPIPVNPQGNIAQATQRGNGVDALYGNEAVVTTPVEHQKSHAERLDRRTSAMQQTMLRNAPVTAGGGHADKFQKASSHAEQAVQQGAPAEPSKH